MIQGKTNSLTSQSCTPVPVFELPGSTSNRSFVHVNLMNSVKNTKIQKKNVYNTVSIYCKNSPELLYLLYLRLELSGHLYKTVKTPMPIEYKRTRMYVFSYVHL